MDLGAPLAEWLGATFATSAVFWAVARLLWGPLIGWGWRRFHGRERTREAVRIVVGVGLLISLLTVAPTLDVVELVEALRRVVLPSLAAAVGLWQALPVLGADAAPVRPRSYVESLDGFHVVLRSRNAGLSAALAGLVPAACLFAVFFVVAWHRVPTRSTTVRVRGRQVEVSSPSPTGQVSRVAVPLRGVSVTREVRWDGTPQLVLVNGDQRVCVPVGGHDPAEVAWVEQALIEGSATGESAGEGELAPEALRRLVASRQVERPT